MNPIRRLLLRSDFRQNPVRAVWRRAFWRIRWSVVRKPWIHHLSEGVSLATPKLGVGAQIYYQGHSEPETARFFGSRLRPGMVFWDVGAHVGEYTMIAAKAVGPSGEVHAFEANPVMAQILEENSALNGFENIRLNRCAVADSMGETEFQVRDEPAVSSLRPQARGAGEPPPGLKRTIRVPAVTLDSYLKQSGKTPDVVKVDVEGAERMVLSGASDLLDGSGEAAPVWILEYSWENCPRFGYEPDELISILQGRGFSVFRCMENGELESFGPGQAKTGTMNLVALPGSASRGACWELT
jgi:FkbM family methyltransferase